jgi:hypothetical protein
MDDPPCADVESGKKQLKRIAAMATALMTSFISSSCDLQRQCSTRGRCGGFNPGCAESSHPCNQLATKTRAVIPPTYQPVVFFIRFGRSEKGEHVD